MVDAVGGVYLMELLAWVRGMRASGMVFCRQPVYFGGSLGGYDLFEGYVLCEVRCASGTVCFISIFLLSVILEVEKVIMHLFALLN